LGDKKALQVMWESDLFQNRRAQAPYTTEGCAPIELTGWAVPYFELKFTASPAKCCAVRCGGYKDYIRVCVNRMVVDVLETSFYLIFTKFGTKMRKLQHS
jgi:hypothetical protein